MLVWIVHLLLHVNARPLWPSSPCKLAAAPETFGHAIAQDAIDGSSPKEVKGRWPSEFGERLCLPPG